MGVCVRDRKRERTQNECKSKENKAKYFERTSLTLYFLKSLYRAQVEQFYCGFFFHTMSTLLSLLFLKTIHRYFRRYVSEFHGSLTTTSNDWPNSYNQMPLFLLHFFFQATLPTNVHLKSSRYSVHSSRRFQHNFLRQAEAVFN